MKLFIFTLLITYATSEQTTTIKINGDIPQEVAQEVAQEDDKNILLSTINNVDHVPEKILNIYPELTVDSFKAKIYDMITDYDTLTTEDKKFIEEIKTYMHGNSIQTRRRGADASDALIPGAIMADINGDQYCLTFGKRWKVDASEIDPTQPELWSVLLGQCDPCFGKYTQDPVTGKFDTSTCRQSNLYWAPYYRNSLKEYDGYPDVECIQWISGAYFKGIHFTCTAPSFSSVFSRNPLTDLYGLFCLGSDDNKGCLPNDQSVLRINLDERNAEMQYHSPDSSIGPMRFMELPGPVINKHGKREGYMLQMNYKNGNEFDEYCTLTVDDQLTSYWGPLRERKTRAVDNKGTDDPNDDEFVGPTFTQDTRYPGRQAKFKCSKDTPPQGAAVYFV